MTKNILLIVSFIYTILMAGDCTDYLACNFNDAATTDDGSCVYVDTSNSCELCAFIADNGETWPGYINDGTGFLAELDSDGDGICNKLDNCPFLSNVEQLNTDSDSDGDLCDDTPCGEQVDDDGVAYISVPSSIFPTIQSAVNCALSGTYIRVSPGTYYENLLIEEDKDVKIVSNFIETSNIEDINLTIIDGSNGEDNDAVIYFKTDYSLAEHNVHIEGFTIKNGPKNGITLNYYKKTVLKNLIIKDNGGHAVQVSPNSWYQTYNKSTEIKNLTISGHAKSAFVIVGESSGDNKISIENSYIYENQASNGSAIRITRPRNVLLNQLTIVNNIGSPIAFVGTEGVGDLSNVTISNSIIWNNCTYSVAYCNGELNSITEGNFGSIHTLLSNYHNAEGALLETANIIYNNIENINAGYIELLDSDYENIFGNISINPLFCDIMNNDFNVALNSSCVDTGSPDLDGDDEDFMTDVDDQDSDGTRLDIGVYAERCNSKYSGSNWYVDVSGNDVTGDGSSSLPFATIKRALFEADRYGGDSVLVSNGIYNENGIYFNGKNVVISGENKDNTIVDGSNDGDIFIFGKQETNQSILNNFTLINSGNYAVKVFHNSNATLSNIIFKENNNKRSFYAHNLWPSDEAPLSLNLSTITSHASS